MFDMRDEIQQREETLYQLVKECKKVALKYKCAHICYAVNNNNNNNF